MSSFSGPSLPPHVVKALGRPGTPPRWSPGSKIAGGTAASDASLVWFTLGRGVLNEVYYPRIDSPCTRDLFLLITGPDKYYCNERDDAEHKVEWLEEGVPGFKITTTCKQQRYQLEKTFISDDRLNVVLEHVRFIDLPDDYRVFAYVNPHLAAHGLGNTAWIGQYKGQPALFAERGDVALALLSSTGFVAASAGFVGKSDGLDELEEHGSLKQNFLRAENGNVALIGEVDLSHGHEFTLALGFGLGPGEAACHATGGLKRNFITATEIFSQNWRNWQSQLLSLDDVPPGRNLYRKSTAILKSHTNKSIPGAVASLAIPWGDARGDDDLLQGAYHLVWSRDLVQHGVGMLAIGAHNDALRVLEYLHTTQEHDGHWPQNMWVSGEPFWDGIQVDQAAQPILFADHAWRMHALDDSHRQRFWPMVRQAAGYIVRSGASTELDRWEEEKGYNAYTLATTISALLAAADWSEVAGEPTLATYLRETADTWQACLNGWLYVRDTKLARTIGVDGYYARILPPGSIEPAVPGQSHVKLLDQHSSQQDAPGHEIVSVDALALVRYGLSSADDPKILNTLRVIDATLKVEMDPGPIWYRYTADRFGEHDDGTPFDTQNKGRGRAWPLLIGERAHYELAAGNIDDARKLLSAMSAYAGEAGLISEQVWDMDEIPEKNLYRGRPSGSASPLIWAHSEYLKLIRSLKDNRVFDLLPQSERYAKPQVKTTYAIWRIDHPVRSVPSGLPLRIEVPESIDVHWQVSHAKDDVASERRNIFGMQVIDLRPELLKPGTTVTVYILPTKSDQAKPMVYTISIVEPCTQ